jgi:predicted dehydrogenase
LLAVFDYILQLKTNEFSCSFLSLKMATVGGFGHGVCVFHEMLRTVDAKDLVQLVGLAPAYAGESIDGFCEDPWVQQSAAPVFDDLASMLLETKPAVLIVSTRPDQIPVAARAGLEAGCHLILEKPVALERSVVTDLEKLARARELHVMAQLSMRAMPAFVAAREAFQAGRIGEPILLNARKSYRWGKRPDWFNDRSLYGGTWPWVGIHALDMTHFITSLKAISATAVHDNRAHPELPLCEDVCSGHFILEGGVPLSVSVDLCRPESAPSHGDDWIRIVGTRGIIEANASRGFCELIEEGHAPLMLPLAGEEAPIYGNFLRGLAQAGAFDDTAFHLTSAALAARDAADSGSTLQI